MLPGRSLTIGIGRLPFENSNGNTYVVWGEENVELLEMATTAWFCSCSNRFSSRYSEMFRLYSHFFVSYIFQILLLIFIDFSKMKWWLIFIRNIAVWCILITDISFLGMALFVALGFAAKINRFAAKHYLKWCYIIFQLPCKQCTVQKAVIVQQIHFMFVYVKIMYSVKVNRK